MKQLIVAAILSLPRAFQEFSEVLMRAADRQNQRQDKGQDKYAAGSGATPTQITYYNVHFILPYSLSSLFRFGR